jgi:hypothetical protein
MGVLGSMWNVALIDPFIISEFSLYYHERNLGKYNYKIARIIDPSSAGLINLLVLYTS